jgi:oligopeptide/dipeptide ABC transporter ATP-binding protein
MIAMALALDPKVLLADEPTTALDVTIQAQIVELMLSLQEQYGTSIVLISHDMGLVAETCDRVVVMYAGRLVEEASVKDLFDRPLHPYTQGLLASLPGLRTDPAIPRMRKLRAIPGTVPDLARLPRGCAFL